MATTAALLHQARTRARISQRELARRAGTAQSVIARIERGQTSPTWETLQRLLAALNLEADVRLEPRVVVGSHMLAEVPGILRMAPEDRLKEVKNVERFLKHVSEGSGGGAGGGRGTAPLDPELLFRCAESDEQHLRPRRVDSAEGLVVRGRLGGAGVRSHLEAWMLLLQAAGELVRHPRRGPQQEQSELATGAERGQWWDQVDAGDWAAKRAALPASGPDDAAAVGKAEVGGLQHTCELAVAVRSHHELRVDRGHDVAAAVLDE